MKKIFIYLFLCFLSLLSFGQGTAYITQSDLVGYPEIIRQYDNLPGNHVIYYKDAPSGIKGYVGLTDVYNNITYSQVVRDCIVKDLEVLGDWAFFCGYTVNTNKALIGWFDIHELASGNGASPFIDSSSLCPPLFPPLPVLRSIENIEVYIDASGDTIVAGYGTDYSSYYVIKYKKSYSLSNPSYIKELPPSYTPSDMTVTDNYVVIAGMPLGGTRDKIYLHPFQKDGVSFPTSTPYYYYITNGTPAAEPINELRIVHYKGDYVSTLSYRYEGQYWMMLREYDVSNVYSSFILPMVAAYRVKFNYSAAQIYDFHYNDANIYTVFHNYEVALADFHDAVTKINFLSGTPSTVQSDYISSPIHVMRSMSLSDSNMYVLYGQKAVGGANAFCKDYQYVTSVSCLSSDILEFELAPIIPDDRLEFNRTSSSSYLNPFPLPTQYDPSGVVIRTICH